MYATYEKGRGGVDGYVIRSRDLETGRVTELFRKSGGGQWALAVSPDGAWVLFGQASVGQSELILVENFR